MQYNSLLAPAIALRLHSDFKRLADRRLQLCAARSSSAMSSFFIFIMACIALGVFRSSPMRAGVICQLRPNLSLSQPHWTSVPPAVSFDQ